MKKLFFKLHFSIFILFFLFNACGESTSNQTDESATSDQNPQESLEPARAYCSPEDLASRQSVYPLLEKPAQWIFQYPSGSEKGGMLSSDIGKNYKSKYLSLYEKEDGSQYMRFSLDASDKGKSKNGSSVRAELRHKKEWKLKGKNSLSYSFYLTSTDFAAARFTVGQFLMHCSKKDSPLCRIELEDGRITAKVCNYSSDGVSKPDGKTWKYDLGSISQGQEVKIKIALDGKDMQLYRDDSLKGSHSFSDNVSNSLSCYFKAGIYYQNKDSPKIFSEIFMRNLETSFE